MILRFKNILLMETAKKNIAKLIFKAKSKTLDIKTQKKWKYADTKFIGCKNKEESGDEILICENLSKEVELQ